MSRVVPLSGNYAVAYAVKMCDVDVISAYPITPQTAIVEKIAEFIANGDMNAEMIHVESEHSALSAAVGASATGARVFTATSSQGLALMYEIMFIASGLRLPIVMTIATRALSPPINIWCDHSDFMSASDTGWIQIMAATNQEVFDDVIIAYRLAEDPQVLLPVMTSLDGYIMTHTIEPVELPDNEEDVIKFAPKNFERRYRLDPNKPITMGPLGPPDWYFEFKRQHYEVLKIAKEVFKRVTADFHRIFGRKYEELEVYKIDDAEMVLISMGGISGTIRVFVDKARKEGIKLGAIRVKLFRPFPKDEISKLIEDKKIVGVVDRAVMPGAVHGGPLFTEVISAAYLNKINVPIIGFVTGLGGRPVVFEHIEEMVKHMKKYLTELRELPKEPIFIGVRE